MRDYPLGKNMASEASEDEPGVAKIKKEFLLLDYKPVLDTEFVSDAVLEQLETERNENTENTSGPPSKRIKLKGRNKHRPKGRKMEASEKLCQAYVKDRDCSFGDRCKFSHDKAKFLETKPEDIGKTCYLFDTYGKCPYGVTCRFAKSHISEDLKNVVKEDFDQKAPRESHVSNVLTKDLQVALWKRRYDFSKSDKIIEKICPRSNNQKKRLPKDIGPEQIQGSPQ
ncbi:hypothetical protein DPMN_062446 [Dreissena polymorpha]|uniref:tRNA-dihydrouridine(47) synthase [NAD(P)(+)] n=1 Tax=Dreissena polymorpha TaxID=45954 RepID=A0A9D4C9R4_DREPO|nr:hypothetical protein DPMN_062446 [Dreissena polymorpha]